MTVTPAFAEEAVLGGLLLDNGRFHDVAPLLSADHFTDASRRRMYAAIRDRVLAGEAADPVTVGEAWPDLFDLAISLSSNVPGASAVVTYGRIVRENWQRREAVKIGSALVSSARSGEEGAVDGAIGALMALTATQSECEYTGKQSMQLAWREVEKAYASGGKLPGITTGLKALDEVMGGFHDSDLTIIGARPAMGKTALMGCLAESAALCGARPGLVSAEQPVQQIGLRRLSAASGVGAAYLRAGRFEEEDWGRLQTGMAKAVKNDMWIYDRSAITLDELVGVARKWKHAHDIRILFIDYAQRITVKGADRISEVSQVARGLKNLARDLNIPVVVLSQVKGSVETRTDRRPHAGDLANSDELAREADQIIMLYRDQVYNYDTPDKGIAELLIEKNRHGPTGPKRVAFLEKTMRFTDLERGDEF